MYHQPQMNQMPQAPFYPTMPPQVYYGNDPARFPSPNGHCSSDDGNPPVQWHGHGCCNHSYFPGHFTARPPYPCQNHVPPAPFFYPFYYPAPQGMYPPVTCFPPHYATELPQYEYYKDLVNGGGHRRSGWCQNHASKGEHGGNVKIVEEDPEVEKKTNSALVPFEAKNYPNPVVCLQPKNNTTNAEENKKSDDSRCKVMDKNFDARASENQQQQPILWNGWFPYYMSPGQLPNQEEAKKNNNQQHEEGAKSQQPNVWTGRFPFEFSKLGSSKPDEEQEGNRHQKDDDKQMNFPFPIFWMPYKPSLTEGEEKPEIATERDITKRKLSGDGEVPLPDINVPPEKHADNKEKPKRNISSGGSNVSNTKRVVKIIPVKQLKEQVEEGEKTSSKIEEIERKPLEEGTNKESSPRKTSKLPPVCLRVEPLPRRKGINGNSRSPCPPGDKRKTYDISGTQSPKLKKKESLGYQSEIGGERSEVAEKISKSTDRAAEAVNGAYKKGEMNLGCKSGDDVGHGNTMMTNENAKRSSDCKEDESVDCDGQKGSEDLEAKITAAEDQSLSTKDSSEEAEESRKLKFSDAEAATMIQAAYRGYELRKWEPLRKLKKLAEVKGGVAGIRHRIQALDSFCNVKDYDKEKSMIMEMIMNLLLKLDAVQGLHVSIRDVRKSTAKELVSLQEMLDAMIFMDKSSLPLLEQPSGVSSKEIQSDLKNEDINIELQKEDGLLEDHDLSKIHHKVSPTVEKCEKQQLHETDLLPNFQKSVAMVNRGSLVDELKVVSGGTSPEFLNGASDSTVIVGGNDNDDHMRREVSGNAVEEDSKDEEMIISSQEHEASEEMHEGSQEGKEEEKIPFEDSKVEEIITLIQEQEAPGEMQEGSQEGKEEEKITGDSKVEEMIISSQEHEAPEEMQEGSQEGREEERITENSKVKEMIISSQVQVSPEEMEGSQDGKMEEKITDTMFLETVLPLGDVYAVDIPIEVPKEAEKAADTSEAEETAHVVVLKESEEAADPCEADKPDLELEREVDEITGRQTGHVLEKGQIEVSSNIHIDEQFEQGEQHKEQPEGDIGPVSGGEATLPLHEGVSSFTNNDVQVELQKGDQVLGTDLSESGGCDDDKVVLMTTNKEVTDGLREEYSHMDNISVEEELEKNDYGLVSGGSEVLLPGTEKSDEIDVLLPGVAADEINVAVGEIENIDHAVIPSGEMDAMHLSSNGSEGVEHVLASATDQADELDLTMPSPTGGQASLESEIVKENDQKLMEENEKLKDMMDKLLEAGSKQLSTISELSSRIDDLEKRLAAKKKKQLRIRRRPKALHPQGISV